MSPGDLRSQLRCGACPKSMIHRQRAASTPEWLLDLAAICAGQTLNEDGQFVTATAACGKIADLRQTLAALPDDAPDVAWGRRFLADRATRPVAPGFTLTRAKAEKLAREMARGGGNAAVRRTSSAEDRRKEGLAKPEIGHRLPT